MNFQGLTHSKQTFRVMLKRKRCMNGNQNVRRCVEEVKAADWREAQRIVLAMPQYAAFLVEGQPKEIR